MADPNAVEPGSPNFGPEPAGLAASVSRLFGSAPDVMAPEPSAYDKLKEPGAALKLLTDTLKWCTTGREAFEWGWWRILLYFLGRQWIYYNPSTRTWNDKRLAKWIPKPVTNKVRETYDSIFALLADITLGITARPVGNAPKNVLTAEAVDQVAPLLHIEHEMDLTMQFADFWAILLGQAYLHPYWDKNDMKHAAAVQLLQCLACRTAGISPDLLQQTGGKCPKCQAVGRAIVPMQGPGSTTIAVIGAGKTKALSPLEILLPMYAQNFSAVDRCVVPVWTPRHDVEALLKNQPDILKKINWTLAPTQRSLVLFKALAMQSDVPSSPAVWNGGAVSTDAEGITIQHLWIKANATYDRGVYMMFVGEGDSAMLVPTEEDPEGGTEPYIPTTKQDGSPLWPFISYSYKQIPGRLYGQGAIDPILGKQDQINQIDSMTQLVANRMGNPVWLEPKGAQVERFTGEPGLIVKYATIGPNNAKPERIAGENPPQSFFALRQQYIADIEDLAGTYDVVKGSKPSGVEAFSALQLLVERSQSRFTPVFKARGEAYRQWCEIAIELERTYGPDQRIKNTLGPNNTWTSQVFKSAQLQGEITIVVEDGSNVPKTALGRRAAIEHSNQLGLLSPATNPDQQYAMMQALGTTDLVPTLDADVKSALQEQQAFEDWFKSGKWKAGIPSPLVRLPWHNDMVHINENRKWMNGDAVREIMAQAGPDVNIIVEALATHLMEHEQMIMMQQQAQQAAAAPAGPGAPGGGGKPGAPGKGGGKDGGGVGAGRAAHDSNQNSRPNSQGTAQAGA